MKIRLFPMIFAAWCCTAGAYVTYPDPDDPTQYLKWGVDNHAGTPGGTIYWSFIPAGTLGSAFCGDACPGTSGDSINIQIAPGAGFNLTPITTWEPQIAAMMAEWSAVTGIRFVKLDSDSGVAINDPAAVPPMTGQIRIGVLLSRQVYRRPALVLRLRRTVEPVRAISCSTATTTINSRRATRAMRSTRRMRRTTSKV